MMFKILNSKLNRKIIIWIVLITLIIIVITGSVMVINERNSLVAVEGIFKETMIKEHRFTEDSLSFLKDENNDNLLASLQDRGYTLAEIMAVIGIEPLRSYHTEILDRYIRAISTNKDVVMPCIWIIKEML